MKFAHPCFVIKIGMVGILFVCLFRFGSKYKVTDVHKFSRCSENSVVGSSKQNERGAVMKDGERVRGRHF